MQITALPGWSGALPSKQYSGYLSFGTKHLHYWFVESQVCEECDGHGLCHLAAALDQYPLLSCFIPLLSFLSLSWYTQNNPDTAPVVAWFNGGPGFVNY